MQLANTLKTPQRLREQDAVSLKIQHFSSHSLSIHLRFPSFGNESTVTSAEISRIQLAHGAVPNVKTGSFTWLRVPQVLLLDYA